MTPMVWMFIASYKSLRERLIEQESISSLIQLEYSGFEGATVPICTFVLSRGMSSSPGAFVRLNDFVGAAVQGPKALEIIQNDKARHRGEETNGTETHLYRQMMSAFMDIPGSPIVYWLSEKMRTVFRDARPLREAVRLREGINTGDNELFLRRWWEVSRLRTSFGRSHMGEPSEKWVPHRKGGAFRRWAGNSEYVVNWGSSGEQIHEYHRIPLNTNGAPMRGKAGFFLPCLSWSRISSGDFSVRSYSSGYSYDSTSPSIFASDKDITRTASLLNSSIVTALLLATSPTLDYRLTALGNIPLPSAWSTYPAVNAREAIDIASLDWDSLETSWGFVRNPLVALA